MIFIIVSQLKVKKTTHAHQRSLVSSVMEIIFAQHIQLSSQTETIEMMGLKIGEYYKQLQNTRSEKSKNFLLQFIENQEKNGLNDLLKNYLIMPIRIYCWLNKY